MAVVGLGFTKINMERAASIGGKLSIKTNAAVKNVEKQELSLGDKKQEALRFTFEFSAIYEPNMASIYLEGEVLWVDKTEAIESALKGWKKDKSLPAEIKTPILNAVLSRSSVEALILSREINLPPPIPLPKVEIRDSKKSK